MAVRSAQTIPDARARASRLGDLFREFDADAMADQLASSLSDRHARILKEFVAASRDPTGTLTADHRRGMSAIPMPVHCRNYAIDSPMAVDGRPARFGQASQALEVTEGIDLRISVWWILPLIALAGTIALSQQMARNQRRSKRHPCALRVTVRSRGLSIKAHFVDVSQTGGKLRLRMKASDLPDPRIMIELPDRTIAANAIWSNDDAVGVSFAARLNRTQLRDMLAASRAQTLPRDDADPTGSSRRGQAAS